MTAPHNEPLKTKSAEELFKEFMADLPSTDGAAVFSKEKQVDSDSIKEQAQNETAFSEVYHVQLKQIEEVRKLKAENDKLEQNNQGRIVLRDAIFILTTVWMLAVLFIVWKKGLGVLNLSDTVLVALITTTTANVFGFLYVVVNYLYNKDKST
jgi:hypothetical protein